MFLKEWFLNRKKRVNLLNWLYDRANSYEDSEKSIYFNINGIVIRYSDHIATTSSGDLQIVKTNDTYIVCINQYKFPEIFTDIERLKLFIVDFIFIYKSLHPHLSPPLTEIIQNKLGQIFYENKEINDESFPVLSRYKKSLRNRIIHYMRNNPEKLKNIYEFLTTYQQYSHEDKLKYWNKFICD